MGVVAIAALVSAIALAVIERSAPALASRMLPARSVVVASPVLAPRIRCHDIAPRPCDLIAEVALSAATDPSGPRVATVDVRAALLCGTTFDCPPYLFPGRQPVGSAVIGFSAASAVWVNVTAVIEGHGPGSTRRRLDAGVIRAGGPR